MSPSIEDSYVVELPSGARVMTVEELDAALDAGLVNASTPLLAPGAASWSTLGALAGLDEDDAPPPTTMLPPPFASSPAAIIPYSPPSLAPVAFGAQATNGRGDDEDELGLKNRRRVVKVIGVVFGAAAAIAIVFGVQSAISQSIASSAAQSALAAQPPASPSPPPPVVVTPPVALPPVVAAVPPPKAAAPAAPVAAPAKAKDGDKKKGKLPSAPKKKK